MRKKISLSVIQTIIDIIDGFLRVSLIEWIVVITIIAIIIAIAFPPKSKCLDQPREKYHPVKQIVSIQPYFMDK
ncbi:MAG: hypothetical protein LBU34_01970 [Planctomycetaceae bacterium]|jgi:hypothetical protein|nr:hypothetical protein [Planctomycetaceae bacterium]